MCELCVYHLDPKTCYQVELRERTLKDINSAVSQGEARATERTKLENARNLLNMLDDASIAKAIGIDVSVVAKLRAEVEGNKS